MPMLRITDSTGDTRMPWSTTEEMEAVKFQFDTYRDNGYAAFADKILTQVFLPDAAEIIMVKPIVGG